MHEYRQRIRAARPGASAAAFTTAASRPPSSFQGSPGREISGSMTAGIGSPAFSFVSVPMSK